MEADGFMNQRKENRARCRYLRKYIHRKENWKLIFEWTEGEGKNETAKNGSSVSILSAIE